MFDDTPMPRPGDEVVYLVRGGPRLSYAKVIEVRPPVGNRVARVKIRDIYRQGVADALAAEAGKTRRPCPLIPITWVVDVKPAAVKPAAVKPAPQSV